MGMGSRVEALEEALEYVSQVPRRGVNQSGAESKEGLNNQQRTANP